MHGVFVVDSRPVVTHTHVHLRAFRGSLPPVSSRIFELSIWATSGPDAVLTLWETGMAFQSIGSEAMRRRDVTQHLDDFGLTEMPPDEVLGPLARALGLELDEGTLDLEQREVVAVLAETLSRCHARSYARARRWDQ